MGMHSLASSCPSFTAIITYPLGTTLEQIILFRFNSSCRETELCNLVFWEEITGVVDSNGGNAGTVGKLKGERDGERSGICFRMTHKMTYFDSTFSQRRCLSFQRAGLTACLVLPGGNGF